MSSDDHDGGRQGDSLTFIIDESKPLVLSMNMANGTSQRYRLRRFLLRYHGTLSFLTMPSMMGLLPMPPAMVKVVAVRDWSGVKAEVGPGTSRTLRSLYQNGLALSKALVASERWHVALASSTCGCIAGMDHVAACSPWSVVCCRPELSTSRAIDITPCSAHIRRTDVSFTQCHG